MADTLQDIGAQMANVMFNLAQRPGDALTGDHVATMDSLRKQWDAAVRATPPSPSTTPEVGERAAFEENLPKSWSRKMEQDEDGGMVYVSERTLGAWIGWGLGRHELASRPAEVDDEGLPPLPEGTPIMHIADETGSGSKAYTAEQYRQGQRDAVAADRARRGDINPADAFVLYSAADVIDECGNVLVALKVRGIADRVIMPEITKVPR